MNRLTVDGRDLFLADPVTELKDQILAAIRAGGGYVNIPGLRGGPGIDILFSPGTQVSWTQIDIGDGSDSDSEAHSDATGTDNSASGDQFGL